MPYLFKRALGIALALYVATFIIGIVCGVVFHQDMTSMDTITDSMWYVGMVGGAVLSAVFTLWYFKNTRITRSAQSGFLFGLTAIVLSSILDLILFTLGNMSGGNVDLWKYYGDFRFWIIVALVVLAATVVGSLKPSRAHHGA